MNNKLDKCYFTLLFFNRYYNNEKYFSEHFDAYY